MAVFSNPIIKHQPGTLMRVPEANCLFIIENQYARLPKGTIVRIIESHPEKTLYLITTLVCQRHGWIYMCSVIPLSPLEQLAYDT